MATMTQFVDNILNVASGFVPSTDERLTPAQITFWVNQYRSKFLPQATDMGKDIPNECWQDLGIMTLARVDKAENPVFNFGMSVRKSTMKIPHVVSFPLGRGIWVGSTDKQQSYIMTTPNNARWKVKNRFAQAEGVKYWWQINQYVYIADYEDNDQSDLKYFNVRMVAQNPAEAHYYYSNGSGIAYDPSTDMYPVNDAISDMITEAILYKEFGLGSRVRPDLTNDAQDQSAFNLPIRVSHR